MNSNALSIWGYQISRDAISSQDEAYIETLPPDLPTVEWIWQEMDRIWDEFGLNNMKPLKSQPIANYYSHPVWLINGIFTALDSISLGHRLALARYLKTVGANRIADYGGGFGELALSIAKEVPGAEISIIEPYPSLLGIQRIKGSAQISVKCRLESGNDAVIAQDVLEHVEDPTELAYEIASSVKLGGIIIFANCFYPVIKCHLPTTFHLRHTFPWVMKVMGLRYCGTVDGAAHAQLFERVGELNLNAARRAERVSKLAGPVINLLCAPLTFIKRSLSHA